MAAVDSLQRNLEAEDAAVAENIRAHEQFAGIGGAAGTGEDRDDMRIMAAGNVTINHPTEKQPAAESPAQPPQPGSSSSALKRWMYPLLIAGLMGGSSLAGSLLTRWWQPSQPAATDTDTDTQYEFGISSRP